MLRRHAPSSRTYLDRTVVYDCALVYEFVVIDEALTVPMVDAFTPEEYPIKDVTVLLLRPPAAELVEEEEIDATLLPATIESSLVSFKIVLLIAGLARLTLVATARRIFCFIVSSNVL
jgi:hypothetical protein